MEHMELRTQRRKTSNPALMSIYLLHRGHKHRMRARDGVARLNTRFDVPNGAPRLYSTHPCSRGRRIRFFAGPPCPRTTCKRRSHGRRLPAKPQYHGQLEILLPKEFRDASNNMPSFRKSLAESRDSRRFLVYAIAPRERQFSRKPLQSFGKGWKRPSGAPLNLKIRADLKSTSDKVTHRRPEQGFPSGPHGSPPTFRAPRPLQ